MNFGPQPYLFHEYGNYSCSLPDFALIPRLTGVIRALTYERALAFVNEQGLTDVYPRFYRSSLAMRADAQKHYLESARLSENNAGYSFWLGIDFPDSPEGCWDEGFLNQLWEPKPGLTEELREQAGPTVLVTRVGVKAEQSLPNDIRLLVTHQLKKNRHGPLIRAGKTAVLLLGTGGFAERRDGYFLNARGGAFGGIIENHPVFAPIPHQGRLHLGIHQLIAGGGLLDAESMPAAFRNGAVVRGLGLTGWISTEKNLQRTIQFTDLTADNGLHLILCSLDLLSNKPESRYVLAGTMKYLLAGKPSPLAARCAAAELATLLR